MSGHSKWATIKHKKAANDAAKGNVFTKISKEIQVAARLGGPDPEGNFRLRLAVQKARAANMPVDNINRSIQKATAAADSAALEEFYYEGYGPGGVAILCDMLTDNKNRCASEVRYLFSRNNGNLGESGCVSYMFDRKGSMTVALSGKDEDELMMVALDAGAEDMESATGFNDADEEIPVANITCPPGELESVQQAIIDAGYTVLSAEVAMMPSNTIDVEDADTATKLMKLISALEDNEDVREVYANYNISDELMEQIQV